MVGRSRAFTKKTAKVQKIGIFTSPQKLRRGGSIVSLRRPLFGFIFSTIMQNWLAGRFDWLAKHGVTSLKIGELEIKLQEAKKTGRYSASTATHSRITL
jgi:hypothetical protein